MPIGLSLINCPLQDKSQRFIHGFHLTIGLRIARRRMLLPETGLESQLIHHLVLEMTTMVSDNLLWNTEARNDLIEKK